MILGTMVVCLSCRKVIWAYNADEGDVRGILNVMQMPCRLCGQEGNYDGWRIDADAIQALDAADPWDAMRKLAERHGFVWAASADNRWFTAGQSIKALEVQA